jgi:predicted CoA-binding protein
MCKVEIKEILAKYKVVAVVGISNTIGKPSHRVSAYLKQHGYKIIPVNPTIEEVFGLKSYKSLLDIPCEIQKTIEIVDIFRKPQDVPPIVDQVIQLKKMYGQPFVVWMQLDIANQEAAEKAIDAGLTVIMDKCIMKEHMHIAPHYFMQHQGLRKQLLL